MSKDRRIIRTNDTRKTLSDKLRDAMQKKQKQQGINPKENPSLSQQQAWLVRKRRAVLDTKNKPQTRPVHNIPQKTSNPSNNHSILLTGGIGDVIALESFFPDDQRNDLQSIYYATRGMTRIREIFMSFKNFPKLTQHITVWDDFSKFFAFYNKRECTAKLAGTNRQPHEWFNVTDWSIQTQFPRITSGQLKYKNSSLLTQTVANISNIQLPHKFMVICPYSVNDRRNPHREFNQEEWANVIKYLKAIGMFGVIVNVGSESIPNDNSLVNLTNKTTITQSVEVLKKASGYIGIDSCLSVLAAKLFDPPYLFVKTQNAHCLGYKHIYYAPKTNFNFLVPRLEF